MFLCAFRDTMATILQDPVACFLSKLINFAHNNLISCMAPILEKVLLSAIKL